MKKVIVEIRAAEGGEDAKLLLLEMMSVYEKASSLQNFDMGAPH